MQACYIIEEPLKPKLELAGLSPNVVYSDKVTNATMGSIPVVIGP
jgi:hypothetical protein